MAGIASRLVAALLVIVLGSGVMGSALNDPTWCLHVGIAACKDPAIKTQCVNLCTPKTGCPDEPGYILITAPVKKCYRAFSDRTRNWFETKALCDLHNWKMAQPADVLSLRSVCIQTLGYHHSWLWLGGRGTGNSFEWVSNGINIRNDDPLWMKGYSRPNMADEPRVTNSDHCLGMAANWHDNLDRTYATWPCTWRGPDDDVYALCEVPM